MFDLTSQACNAPTKAHFNYDGQQTLRDMNQKLCLFESVTVGDNDNWSFQCHANSNIALVCMEEPGAIYHQLRVSKNVFNLY